MAAVTRGRGRPALLARSVSIAAVAALVAGALAGCGSSAAPTGSTRPAAATASTRATSAAPSAVHATASSASPTASPQVTNAPGPTGASDPVLIGAGDICVRSTIDAARATAALIEAEPSASVFTAGDNTNEHGKAAEYRDCYAPTWGRFLARTRPAIGNHDYGTGTGAAYFAYFGAAAGARGQGWYSYDLPNRWHVVVLNSICWMISGCGRGSPQETWLRRDLAAHAGTHVIAIWHVPAFSSGYHGSSSAYQSWWQDLQLAGAELVLSGHDHDYERFARLSATGAVDESGIREFVVGTGGAYEIGFGGAASGSERRIAGVAGVLRLVLHADSYEWQFIATDGSVRDSGRTACHR